MLKCSDAAISACRARGNRVYYPSLAFQVKRSIPDETDTLYIPFRVRGPVACGGAGPRAPGARAVGPREAGGRAARACRPQGQSEVRLREERRRRRGAALENRPGAHRPREGRRRCEGRRRAARGGLPQGDAREPGLGLRPDPLRTPRNQGPARRVRRTRQRHDRPQRGEPHGRAAHRLRERDRGALRPARRAEDAHPLQAPSTSTSTPRASSSLGTRVRTTSSACTR